jgi:hypothetical protein
MLTQLLAIILAQSITSLPTPDAITEGFCTEFYLVHPGDSLFSYASTFLNWPISIGSSLGLSIGFLKDINRDIAPNPDLIFPGQKVCIGVGPTHPSPIHPLPELPHLGGLDCNGYPLPGPNCIDQVIVTPGDTLFCIATKLFIPLHGLISMNPQIPNPDLIFPGQTVCIAVAPFGKQY